MTAVIRERRAPARHEEGRRSELGLGAPGKDNPVPAGYKQTEVGVIPEDWEVRRFSDHFKIYAGGDVPRDSLSLTQSKEHPYPIFANALQNRGLYGYTGYRRANPDSVTITARGYLGHAEYRTEPFFPIVRLLVLEPVGLLHAQYTTYAVNDRVVFAIESTGVPQLTAPQVGKYAVAGPPTLAEQRAIATALSDVDELIESLEKLIAKKRAIKTGTMQQLLTPPGQPGHKRLPGFSGEWEVKRLGDFGATYGGLTGKTKVDFGVGNALYISFMNIMTNVVVDCSTFEQVQVAPGEPQNAVMRGDLFFNGSSETPEEVGMCALLDQDIHGVYLNSFCFGFRQLPDASANGLFLAYYFRSGRGRELLKSLAQGATRYNLSKRSLLIVPFLVPSVDEQEAIAAVLSDMDTEIEALEARLEKTRAIKQGMMQKLLTGRVRLVGAGERTDRADPTDPLDPTDLKKRRTP